MVTKADQIRKLSIDGFSVKEISKIVGCSSVYVYQVKHKAKKAFVRDLKKIDKNLGVKSPKPSVIPSTKSDQRIPVLLFVLGLAAGYIAVEFFSKI